MLEIMGRYKGYKILPSGNFEISFEADRVQAQKIIKYGIQDTVLDLSVKKHREKRSLNANNYFWQLVGKLAEKLNVSKEEIYHRYIKHYGIYQTISINDKAANTISHIWNEHGLGWIAEKIDSSRGNSTINLYYGTSTYNTKQMSRILSAVVEDCKLQGIETLPPEQLKGMLDVWNTKAAY